MSEKILEEFTGFVDKIEGEKSYITLTADNGEEIWGEYPTSELKRYKLTKGDSFHARTIAFGDCVRFEIDPGHEALEGDTE